MNDECRWYTVSAGDTLLELTAKSCCRLKGALVLDRIMAARWGPQAVKGFILVLQKVPSEDDPKVRNHGESPY